MFRVVYCFVFVLFRVSFWSLSNVSVVYGFVFRFRLLVMFLSCTVSCFRVLVMFLWCTVSCFRFVSCFFLVS